MVDVPIWREGESPVITSPLTGKCGEAGRARASRRTEESFAIFILAWLCLMSKVRLRKAYWENSSYVVALHSGELLGHQSGSSFLLQENSCRCSATTTQETDGTLRGIVQSTKHTESKCALGIVHSSWNCTQGWAGKGMVKLSSE